MSPIYQAVVNVAENDCPVKMRNQPRANAKILDKVPEGTIVDVFSDDGEWSRIMYNGQTGYMMRKFLIRENDPKENGNDAPAYALSREALVSLKALIVPLLQEIEKCLGGGD